MALTSGTHLGAYQIVSGLGAGAMGEVYRARDTKLNRTVAIKVLHDAFASDSDRLARFTREAQMLGSLNHPNIAHIYGLEEFAGVRALVMELVEGEDLSQRIARGAMPLDEVVPIATQIAEALEAAHEQGVVHRDLKPANIRVRADGVVKVLDFGLAKLATGGGSDAVNAGGSLTQSPTVTSAAIMTRPGTVLGSAAYMSPEQARGKPVDKRTDIWAFGCVLYELLTAQRAFPGATVSDTIAAVLDRDPDWSALPTFAPGAVRRVLQRCLIKDARHRMRDIGDVRLELAELNTSEGVVPGTLQTVWRPTAAMLLVVLAVGALLGGVAVWMRTPSHNSDSTRFTFTLPLPDSFAPAPAFALSPDGTRIAHVQIRAGTRFLFVRELTQFEAALLPGTDDASQPFFSPDGRSIGFFAQGKLKRVAISGGAPVTLADAVSPRGGSWGANETIAFAPTASSPLLQISAGGGVTRSLTTLDRERGEGGHRWPEYLPDGKSIVFAAGPSTSTTSWSEARISLVTVESGERMELVPRGTYPRYVTGRLFFVEKATLRMRPFDPDRPTAASESVAVLEHVAQGGGGGAQVALSRNGSLAYGAGMSPLSSPLVWVNRTGIEEALPIPPAVYTTPRLSPDGHRIAMTQSNENSEVWVYDVDRGTSTRLTFEGGNLWPVWTRDGTQIVFSSNRQGSTSLFWTRADGDRTAEPLTTTDTIHFATSWSPGGDVLLLTAINAASNADILMLNRSTRTVLPFVKESFAETQAVFSPDGRFVAYVSNDGGREEVFVRPFPGRERKWQISNDGGREPVWAPSGRELFYRRGDDMMAVDIAATSVFTPGKPRRLFTGRYATAVVAGYDVSADGSRFLMVKNTDAGPLREVRVALNWANQLRQ